MGDVPPLRPVASVASCGLRSVLAKLVAVIPQAIDGYFAHRLGQHAAAIAYRVLFSLAPLAIVLVSVFGLVLQNDEVRRGRDRLDRRLGARQR